MTFEIYSPVRLTIQDRDCVLEVAEVPDDCPALLGQIPLEMLDFVVDPSRTELTLPFYAPANGSIHPSP